MIEPKRSLKVDKLEVNVFEQKTQMGEAAANFVSIQLKQAIDKKGEANLILATGASQFPFLDALKMKDIDWEKITVFHLDEYRGISMEHPASFRKYLKDRILDLVKPKKVYLLDGNAPNLSKVVEEYEKLLKSHPIDLACIGIGENGHIAFNDPPVADFNDPKFVKIVELDKECRMQQYVPKEALSLTITAILSCKTISCVVPDKRKSNAVFNTLYNEISTTCPASILREHNDTVLFLDEPSASKIM